MKQKLTLVIAIFAGIVAMVLTKVYVDSQLKAVLQKYEMVEVVAAAKDLTAGTTLTQDMVGGTMVPRRSSTDAIKRDQLPIILKRKVQTTVMKNTPIRWSDLEGSEQKGGLASMVKENERALSIPVDITSSVTGLVEPNDHVDILGTFTFPSTKGDPQLDTVTLTILQNVTILATGKETARNAVEAAVRGATPRSASYSTVTLLVTPKEAEMLVFAMGKGRLTLTLRNPADVSSARDLTNINFNYLEKKVGEFNDARQQRLQSGGER